MKMSLRSLAQATLIACLALLAWHVLRRRRRARCRQGHRRLPLPGPDRLEPGRQDRSPLRLRAGEPRRRQGLHGRSRGMRRAIPTTRATTRTRSRSGSGSAPTTAPSPRAGPRSKAKEDARAEANRFIDVVGKVRSERPPAGARRRGPVHAPRPSRLRLWIRTWMNRVEKKLQRQADHLHERLELAATGDTTSFADRRLSRSGWPTSTSTSRSSRPRTGPARAGRSGSTRARAGSAGSTATSIATASTRGSASSTPAESAAGAAGSAKVSG